MDVHRSMDALSILHADVRLETMWEPDPGLEQTPLIDVAALLAGARRAVIIAPHPDDEIIGTGGLLAEFTAMAFETLIISVTDGEASLDGSQVWTRAALRVRRIEESIAALHAIGFDPDNVVRLHIADGHIRDNQQELTKLLRWYLRDGDLVITPCSKNGNPDYVACSRAVVDAVNPDGTAVAEVPVWTWQWVNPDDDAELPWPSIVRIGLSRDAQVRKRHALEFFETQLRPDPHASSTPALNATTLRHFDRPFETLLQCA